MPESEQLIEVRDARNQPFFWIDKSFIESGLSEKVGVYGIAVYMILSFHANREAKCWPSQASIAKKIGCSVDSVVRAVSRLVEFGLIFVEHIGIGPRSKTIYTLRSIPAISGDYPRPQHPISPPIAGIIPAETPKNNNKGTRSRKQQPETTIMSTAGKNSYDELSNHNSNHSDLGVFDVFFRREKS